MSYKAVIFDLDGTLTNTLPDLTNIMNITLRELGYPERTEEEIRKFVGNGVKKLVDRSLPPGIPAEASMYDLMQENYIKYQNTYTKLYEGIPELLDALRGRGCKLGVVSNKPDPAVQAVIDYYMKGQIDYGCGAREGLRTKPAPDLMNLALDALGVTADECIYVGDSEVDIETGNNARMLTFSATWGFRDVETLKEHGAYHLVDTPAQLLKYIGMLA